MIKFVKLNESFTKIVCEPYVLPEIAEHFEFFSEGYQYSPEYKKGYWDGKIRLISGKTGRFYTGLLKEVIKKLKELGYNEFSFENFDKPNLEYTEKGILDAIERFKLPVHREVREHQLNAILTCLMGKRRVIESPTSSGKSLVIYIVSRMLAELGKKVLIITPTTMLVDQLVQDIEDYSINDNEYDVNDNYHKVYAGKAKNIEDKIIISTWQSIIAIPKTEIDRYLQKFDAVIVDEAHGADSSSLKMIMEKSINADYRIGLSGTIKDSRTHYLVLLGIFGTIKKMISIKELMDLGYIAKLKIKCIVLNYTDEMKHFVSGMEYDEELDTIIGYRKRNQFIANLANKIEGNTLTILRYVEKHAKVLKEMYDAKNNKITYLLTGDTDKDDAMIIKNHMENVTNTNIMGTFGKLATGISIINLNNGIIASPSKSKIKVLQFIGRLLRKGKNKDHATIYDIVDNLTYEDRENFLMRHFRQRYKFYKDEGFDIEVVQINIG